MAQPGSIGKARSSTPKPVNVQRRDTPADLGSNLGQPDRHALRMWRLNDYDWVRFNGGVGYDL
eukprot:11206126-Heterocapsa_arctica.AAC.1